MATVAKRQLALPAALSKKLDQLARREGKSTVEVLQDLVSENKHNRLERNTEASKAIGVNRRKQKVFSRPVISRGISRNRESRL